MAAGLRAGVAVLVAAVTTAMLMLPVWLLPPSTGQAFAQAQEGDPVVAGVAVAIVAGILASVILFVALRHGHLEGL
jgi:uncharacterized membrane protein